MIEIPAWLTAALILAEALFLARRWRYERDPMIGLVALQCVLLGLTYAGFAIWRTPAAERALWVRTQLTIFFLTLIFNHLGKLARSWRVRQRKGIHRADHH